MRSLCATWLLASYLLYLGDGIVKSDVTCSRGEYKDEISDKCRDCPPRTYQNEYFHQRASCNAWTEKPDGQHWVKIKQGSAEYDHQWACEEGYEENESLSKCVEIPTTTPSPTTTTEKVISIRPSDKVVTVLHPTSKPASEDEYTHLIIIVVGGSICILLFIFVVIRDITKKKSEAKKNNKDNGNFECIDLANEQKLQNQNKCLKSGISEGFCRLLVRGLGSRARFFLYVLFSPYGDFDARSKLFALQQENRPFDEICSLALLHWAEENDCENSCGIIQEALDFLEIKMEQIDFGKSPREAVISLFEKSGKWEHQQEHHHQYPQALFRLSYYLATKFQIAVYKHMLSVSRADSKIFQADTLMDTLGKKFPSDPETVAMEAFLSWHDLNKNVDLKGFMNEFFKEIDNNEFPEDEKFIELLHYASHSEGAKAEKKQVDCLRINADESLESTVNISIPSEGEASNDEIDMIGGGHCFTENEAAKEKEIKAAKQSNAKSTQRSPVSERVALLGTSSPSVENEPLLNGKEDTSLTFVDEG